METSELRDQDITSEAKAESQTTPLVNSTSDHDSDNKDSSKSEKLKKKLETGRDWKLIVEVAVLSSIFIFVLGVYAALPTVFYVLKPVLQV